MVGAQCGRLGEHRESKTRSAVGLTVRRWSAVEAEAEARVLRHVEEPEPLAFAV